MPYLIRSTYIPFSNTTELNQNRNKVENCYCVYIDAYECVCAHEETQLYNERTHTPNRFEFSLYIFFSPYLPTADEWMADTYRVLLEMRTTQICCVYM